MAELKVGVTLGYVPAMIHLMQTVDQVYRDHGYGCVLTSGTDGAHKQGSLHYADRALDYRTRHVTAVDRQRLADEIARRLGAMYDVVLESDHLHVEWDPR